MYMNTYVCINHMYFNNIDKEYISVKSSYLC